MDTGVVKKWSVLVLCFAISLTCVHLTGTEAFAEGDEIGEGVEVLSLEEQERNRQAAKAELDKELGITDAAGAASEEEIKDADPVRGVEPEIRTAPDAEGKLFNERKPKGLSLNALHLNDLKLDTIYDEETGGYVYATDPDNEGFISLSGVDISSTGYKYRGIFISDSVSVDDAELLYEFTEAEQYSFSGRIDMKRYSVGYHTIFVLYSNDDGSQVGILTLKYIPTFIYEKPSNSINNYYTYIRAFDFKYDSSSYYYSKGPGEYLNIYMDYRKGTKGKWSKKVYEADSSWRKKNGLKPNTTYQSRMMYGKEFEYDGETFVITGRLTGYASSAKKFMTAYTKPKVKKIDISKVKQYCHKNRYQYAWKIWYNKYTGVIVRRKPLYRTVRYWYTRFKVTVKFKKKQKIAGIRIDTIHGLGTWKGGNKKAYSQTFTSSGKKRGRMIRVKVKSCRSNKYGGWSKVYSKRVRCR